MKLSNYSTKAYVLSIHILQCVSLDSPSLVICPEIEAIDLKCFLTELLQETGGIQRNALFTHACICTGVKYM